MNRFTLTEKITLENEHVRLVPMSTADSHALFEAARNSSGQTFDYMAFGPFSDHGQILEYMTRFAADKNQKAFTVYSRRLQKICGALSLLNIYPEHARCEIGSVWYEDRARGSEINSAAVLLLLEHLFDNSGCRRVEWKCDRQNAASMAAARGLSFAFEGIFYKHMLVRGKSRDTAWFSVTEEEWPEVKERLLRRVQNKCQPDQPAKTVRQASRQADDKAVIRHGCMADLSTLVKLAGNLAEQLNIKSEPAALEVNLARLLESDHHDLLVAEHDEQPAAFLVMVHYRNALASGMTSLITELMVSPGLRGIGTGRQLVSRAGQVAADKGSSSLEVGLKTDNRAAARFYRQCGFSDTFFLLGQVPADTTSSGAGQ